MLISILFSLSACKKSGSETVETYTNTNGDTIEAPKTVVMPIINNLTVNNDNGTVCNLERYKPYKAICTKDGADTKIDIYADGKLYHSTQNRNFIVFLQFEKAALYSANDDLNFYAVPFSSEITGTIKKGNQFSVEFTYNQFSFIITKKGLTGWIKNESLPNKICEYTDMKSYLYFNNTNDYFNQFEK